VINSRDVAGGVTVASSSADVPIEAVAKRHEGATYVFAVGMRDGQAEATFKVAGLEGKATAEVVGEGRTIEVVAGEFRDSFGPWGVHLYRINSP
jgi:hypothetical protein